MNYKFSDIVLHDEPISANVPLMHRIGTKTYIPTDLKGNFKPVN